MRMLKAVVKHAPPLFVFASFYFLGAAIAQAVLGNYLFAVSNLLFFTVVLFYSRSSRIMEQQRTLIDEIMASNQRLIDTLQAEAHHQTLETLERQRRATWS